MGITYIDEEVKKPSKIKYIDEPQKPVDNKNEALGAAIYSMGEPATFGLSKYAIPAAKAALTPKTYSETRKEYDTEAERLKAKYPKLSTISELTGYLAGLPGKVGSMVGKQVIESVPKLAPKVGEGIAKAFGKRAVTAGATGASTIVPEKAVEVVSGETSGSQALKDIASTSAISGGLGGVAPIIAEKAGKALEKTGKGIMQGYVKIKPTLIKKNKIDIETIFKEKLAGKPEKWPEQIQDKIETIEANIQTKLAKSKKRIEYKNIVEGLRADVQKSINDPKGGEFSGAQDKALEALDELDAEIFAKSDAGKFTVAQLNELKRDFYNRSRKIIQAENRGAPVDPKSAVKARVEREISKELKLKIEQRVPEIKEINRRQGSLIGLKEGIEDANVTMSNRSPGGPFLDIAGSLAGAGYSMASNPDAIKAVLPALAGYGAMRVARSPMAAKGYYGAGKAIQNLPLNKMQSGISKTAAGIDEMRRNALERKLKGLD
jgi:hypothetical protein